VESQHPDVVRRPDADAHRGASADQPGQPCATARRCDPSGEIESSVGSGYGNQDRESDLQWIVCTAMAAPAEITGVTITMLATIQQNAS
jgi:hypothetical protein